MKAPLCVLGEVRLAVGREALRFPPVTRLDTHSTTERQILDLRRRGV